MRHKWLLPLLLSSALLSTLALAAPPDAWLHVKVDNTEGNKEHVRVNVPLTLAEKVLPAIQVHKMHSGKVSIGHDNVSIDPKALVEAVRSTADGVFVTVESDDQNVRVAKERGYLLVKVTPGAAPKGRAGRHKPDPLSKTGWAWCARDPGEWPGRRCGRARR